MAQQYYGPPQYAHGYNEVEEAIEQRGYYDGMKGAERDFRNHRQPNVNNREEYRDPGLHSRLGAARIPRRIPSRVLQHGAADLSCGRR